MKTFRLPTDITEVLEAEIAEGRGATEFVVQAIREKVRNDKIERLRQSARRIASLPNAEFDVEYALAAQTEVVGNE
jgi:hypothetical protein